MTEKDYLKQYDITKFERPSIAADITVFSIMDEKTTNLRKMNERKLKILLVKRGSHPCKDMWALPGGFCRSNEDVYTAARRELKEETGVENAYLQLSDVYSDIGRDPRGWIISNTFLALINGAEYRLHAGTDAWEAKWFDIMLDIDETITDSTKKITTYKLSLIHESIILKAIIKETCLLHNYHKTIEFVIEESIGFAFDHAKIIVASILKLREKVENDDKIVFDLMPEKFTLTELQKSFEIVLGKELIVPNFRRKIVKYVTETNEVENSKGFRPAIRYKRNDDMFCV